MKIHRPAGSSNLYSNYASSPGRQKTHELKILSIGKGRIFGESDVMCERCCQTSIKCIS